MVAVIKIHFFLAVNRNEKSKTVMNKSGREVEMRDETEAECKHSK